MTLRRLLLAAALCLLFVNAGRAQLAQSFYNITAIETKTLPNGIQITIRTDGTVNLGVDINEFLVLAPRFRDTKILPMTSFRLRFIGARSRIAANTDIGVYPADSARVTLADDEFTGSPFYYQTSDTPPVIDKSTPKVDIRFSFYVPIRVPQFSFVFGDYYGWDLTGGSGLQSRDVGITVSSDRRSVIITAISDRVEDVRRRAAAKRSRPADWNHRLTIAGNGTAETPLHLEALHVPLSQVVDAVAHATGTPLTVTGRDADVDISLFLPRATLADAIEALERGFSLTTSQRSADAGGGYVMGRSGAVNVIERIPLTYLKPEAARLLLPDFLLRDLRADPEHNALVVSAPPTLIAKIREDIAKLDQPPPQFEIEASVYEISRNDADALALQGALGDGKAVFDTSTESFSAVLKPGQKATYAATLDALLTHSRGRLIARPHLTVASGATGTLFAGQTRYLTVLQGGSYGSGQNIQSLQLPIGTSLTVTPTSSGGDAPITLEIAPSVSTIDSIEKGTGLPTVGTRSINSVVRLGSGDTLLIAGLSLTSEESTLNHTGSPLSRVPVVGPALNALFPGHSQTDSNTELIMLVTAHLLPLSKEDHT